MDVASGNLLCFFVIGVCNAYTKRHTLAALVPLFLAGFSNSCDVIGNAAMVLMLANISYRGAALKRIYIGSYLVCDIACCIVRLRVACHQ